MCFEACCLGLVSRFSMLPPPASSGLAAGFITHGQDIHPRRLQSSKQELSSCACAIQTRMSDSWFRCGSSLAPLGVEKNANMVWKCGKELDMRGRTIDMFYRKRMMFNRCSFPLQQYRKCSPTPERSVVECHRSAFSSWRIFRSFGNSFARCLGKETICRSSVRRQTD